MVEFFPEQAVFLSMGGFAIRWYGMAYAIAFWIAWAVLPGLGARRGVALSRDQWTLIVAFGAFGALIGGRLGYALFYETAYFFENPVELVRIWHGGMSSHGGFIGAGIGVWAARYFSPSYEGEREGVSLLAIADVITVPAALGLAIGRLANVANGEFGSYAVYEAMANGAIAVVCYVLLRSGREKGATFAIFLILYSISRFSLEFVREQEWPIVWGLSLGQLYTIPLFLFGMLLFLYARKFGIQSKV